MRPPRTPSGPRDPPGVEAGERGRHRVGPGGQPSLRRLLGRHHGQLPGSSSRDLAPPRPGTPGTASTPSLHSTAGNTATPSPSTPSTTLRTLKRHHCRHHHTARRREPCGVPSHVERSGIAPPRLPHPPRRLRHHQRRTTRSKSPRPPDDEMPQAPSPPTAQERPHPEPLTHPITKMELPPKHRTIPDRNAFCGLPREWAIHNGTLRWDEITPGLQAIRLHSITKTHHHLDTSARPPPSPPSRQRGCRRHTNRRRTP